MNARLLATHVACLIVLAIPARSAAYGQHRAPEQSTQEAITVRRGLLTARVIDSPLQRVLQAVARQSGIKIFIHGATDERVTFEFRGLPVEEGLRRILKNTSSVLIYSSRMPPDPAAARIVSLKEVRVYLDRPEAAHPVPVAANTPTQPKGPGGEQPLTRPGHPQDTEAIEELAYMLLQTDSELLRKRSAHRLGRIGDAKAVDLLSRALSQDEDPSVRESAAKALGKTWKGSAAAPLAAAVVADPDPYVREAAAKALGKTWSEAAVEPLSQTLLQDRSAFVREAAARGLGETWSEAAVEPLVRTLWTDPSLRVRESAAQALSVLGYPAASY